jgi:hypothetical protein
MVGPQTWDPTDPHGQPSSFPLSKEQDPPHPDQFVAIVVVVVQKPQRLAESPPG